MPQSILWWLLSSGFVLRRSPTGFYSSRISNFQNEKHRKMHKSKIRNGQVFLFSSSWPPLIDFHVEISSLIRVLCVATCLFYCSFACLLIATGPRWECVQRASPAEPPTSSESHQLAGWERSLLLGLRQCLLAGSATSWCWCQQQRRPHRIEIPLPILRPGYHGVTGNLSTYANSMFLKFTCLDEEQTICNLKFNCKTHRSMRCSVKLSIVLSSQQYLDNITIYKYWQSKDTTN